LKKTKIIASILFLIVALCVMAIYSRADPILTLTTTESDYMTPKTDYSPEETVYIVGTGFDASTGIFVSVQRPDGTVTTSADLITGAYKVTITSSETGMTDASGSFTATYQLDGVLGTYTMTATDGTNTIEKTFTDSPKIASVSVDPATLSLVTGTDAVFTVTVTRGSGSDAITADLSIIDASDPSLSGAFDPSTVSFAAGSSSGDTESSTLTIDTSGLEEDTYTFKVKATRSDSGTTNDWATADVTLEVWDLDVSKTVETKWTLSYDWSIDKVADPSELTLAVGDTYDVHYKITVDATEINTYEVWGEITIYNPSDTAVVLSASDITDTIDPDGDAISATIDPSGLVTWDYTLDGDSSLVVEYYAELPDWDGSSTTNIASVTVNEVTFESDAETVAFSSVPDSTLHESITVDDTYTGTGSPQDVTVEVGVDTLPKTFEYDRTIGPYEETGTDTVSNTASYVADDDSEVTDEATCDVSVTIVDSCSFVGVTSSGFVEIDTFKLIFTPDMPTNPGFFRLTASNPGQFYFNIYHMVEGGEEFDIDIPYPFITQGANPVQIYDEEPDGYTPQGNVINLAEYGITIDGSPILLAGYGTSPSFVDSIRITVTNGDYEGPMYITIHLDYGLKKVATGYTKSDLIGLNAINSLDGYLDILNTQTYTFSVSGAFPDSDSIINDNAFKHDPGIGGLVIDEYGNPVANEAVTVTSKDMNEVVYTDEDGWYMCAFKYTGKPTSFTIKVAGYPDQTFTIRSNSFVVVNFDKTATIENTGSTIPEAPASPPGKGKK
jgi:hypothetical protein